eukprot:gene33257-62882_t
MGASGIAVARVGGVRSAAHCDDVAAGAGGRRGGAAAPV